MDTTQFFAGRFEDIGSSNGQYEDDDDEEDTTTEGNEVDGIVRTRRKKKAPKEHVSFALVQVACIAVRCLARFPTMRWLR